MSLLTAKQPTTHSLSQMNEGKRKRKQTSLNPWKQRDEAARAVLTGRLIEGDDQRLKCIKCLQLSLSVRVQVLEQDRQSLLDDGRVHAAVAVVICWSMETSARARE